MEQITPVDALKQAVDFSGGQSSFASKLASRRNDGGVSQAQVWNWINRGNGAPATYCPDIEALTGIKCELLRPDTNWAVLRKQPRKAKEAA